MPNILCRITGIQDILGAAFLSPKTPLVGGKVGLSGSTAFSPMRRSRALLIKKLCKKLLVLETIELKELECLVLKSWLALLTAI